MFDLVLACEKAKKASKSLLSLTEEKKKEALIVVAKALRDNSERLINENAKDIKLAKEQGATLAFIDRLTLNEKVIEGMAVGIEQVAQLNSPLNKVTYSYLNKEQVKYEI